MAFFKLIADIALLNYYNFKVNIFELKVAKEKFPLSKNGLNYNINKSIFKAFSLYFHLFKKVFPHLYYLVFSN